MTDPLSERLEQANELCAAHLHSHLGANVEWLKKQLSDYFTSILQDEIAAAEESGFNEAQERASNNLPGIVAQYMGNGTLARHDAAVRERTLETTFAEREVCNAILRIAQAFHEQEALGQVDTPGGFEHMGDVWSRICEWEKLIIGGRALKTPQPAVES